MAPLTARATNATSSSSASLSTANKENSHTTKSASVGPTRTRRKTRRVQPPMVNRAPGAVAAEAHRKRLVREGRRQREVANSSYNNPTPANAETAPSAQPAESSTSTSAQSSNPFPFAAAPGGLMYNFPRFLPRYPFPKIKPDALAAIDEQLRTVPIDFILGDLMTELAPMIQRGLDAISTDIVPPLTTVPSHVTLRVRPDVEGPLRLPTHVLAIKHKGNSAFTLYPIHDVLFAAHCAHLPFFYRPESPLEVEVRGDGVMTITLPTVEYELPDPLLFRLLYIYLYKNNVAGLLQALMPPLNQTLIHHIVSSTGMMATSGRAPPPFYLAGEDADKAEAELANDESDEDSEFDEEYDDLLDDNETTHSGSSRTTSPPTSPTATTHDAAASSPSDTKAAPSTSTPQFEPTPEQKRQAAELEALALALAKTYTLQRLLQQVRVLHGFWQNVIMLGVADIGVWNAMDYAWSTTMRALLFSSDMARAQQGQPQRAPAPAPTAEAAEPAKSS